tara:strand:- start:155 stop:298 length:144 start_codon:yes stop_codon:yes gene_type:complete
MPMYSRWWVVDEVSLDLLSVLAGHEWWTKSVDGGGDKFWSKVPHSDD